MSEQLTKNIIMIRPRSFGFNQETAVNNKFQTKIENVEASYINEEAIKEFDMMVQKLRAHNITVDVFEDIQDSKLPDSIFPNNWISTHQDGGVFTYPMFAPSRRLERREDIIDQLNKQYKITKRYNLELFELQNQFLEGTGSLILDRVYKYAYACLSPRTDKEVLKKFSQLSGYKSILFKATDHNGYPIYHTNVMMSVGLDFVCCCMSAVDTKDKNLLYQSFDETSKLLVDLTFEQMANFAGNMLELINNEGHRFLVCSSTAYNSLRSDQISVLENRTNFLVVEIPMIEKIGGGSARCMIAENFLPML
jgi:hypothetical protein